MENALKKLSPSMSALAEIQALEIIDAELPSSPKLAAAWGSLRLRKASSPETGKKKSKRGAPGKQPSFRRLGIKKNLRKVSKGPWSKNLFCQSHLCVLTGQLSVLQSPQRGDWTWGSTRAEAGSVFSPLDAQWLSQYRCLINTYWVNKWINKWTPESPIACHFLL